MKQIIGHVYGNTKEDVKELIDVMENAGYEIAYESDSHTSASVIKEMPDEE